MELHGEDFHNHKAIREVMDQAVTLDTFHWYCDNPEPTTAARHYDTQIHQRKFVVQHLDFFLALQVI